MSSLAAAKADSFYYPPEWTPDMGSISKFQGSRGKNQYERKGIIRFELPYNSWCDGCSSHIAKGVRFNAKKAKAGDYFSTKIWQFTMNCPSCRHEFIIKTNPEKRDYDFVSGIHRQATANDDAEIQEDVVISKSSQDAMSKLSAAQLDVKHALQSHDLIDDLISRSDLVHKDDYKSNQALRRGLRSQRTEERQTRHRLKMYIPIAPVNKDDDVEAGKIIYSKSKLKSRVHNSSLMSSSLLSKAK